MRTTKKMASVVILIKKRQKKVLLMLRDKRSSTFQHLWGFAGGLVDKLDDNVIEHPIQTAKREVLEETGIVVKKLFFIEKEQRKNTTVFFFYCTDFEGEMKRECILEEHSAAAWVEVKDFSKAKTIPGSSKLLLKSLKLIRERGLF